MKKSKLINQRAFTFVEVLVATLIVAMVMTALGSMMALSARVAEANEMEQLAQLKAQQAIEFFRRERQVRGWRVFYDNLSSDVYCISNLPEDIQNIDSNECSIPKTDFNFFYYTIEANVTQISSAQIDVQINIYRYNKSGNIIGDPGEAFFSADQSFKEY